MSNSSPAGSIIRPRRRQDLWRQGNLLHFGFEQSPAEMNDSGKLLLLNAIAYISHFTEDRPIAITPSVFAGPVARGRSVLARWLRNPEYSMDSCKSLLAPATWKTLSKRPDRESMAQWADENARFLHPNRDQLLEIDDDLVASGVSFDQPEFFDKVLADLRSEDRVIMGRAQRLLKRYVPIGPSSWRFQCLGFVVEGKSAIRFCLRRGRLPLVHRSPCKETRRALVSVMRGPKRASEPFADVTARR